MELGTALHEKQVANLRIGAMSNAGFETVGMADAIQGPRYKLELPELPKAAAKRIEKTLAEHKLTGLVNVRNPLDLTPMANDEVFEACARALVEDDEIGAAVIGFVPLTPQMRTTEAEIAQPGSLADRLPVLLAESTKPVVAVIDSGAPYDALARRLQAGGVPVFRSCDQALNSLGQYLCRRYEMQHAGSRTPGGIQSDSKVAEQVSA